MRSPPSIPRLWLCLLGSLFWPLAAKAYLGGFEEQDGYRVPLNGLIPSQGFLGDASFYLDNNPSSGTTGVVPLGAYPNTLGDGTNGPDLSRYNAGQFGTNQGGPGGTAADIPDNSGLWQVLAGGRLNEDANAPYYYDGQYTRDQIVAYRQTTPHSGTQSLGLIAGDTNLSYLYNLDARDFGGTAPADTTSSLIQMSFWVNPTDWDDPDTGHLFGLTLLDSGGQSIFGVGYTGDNLLEYRLLTDGLWHASSSVLGTLGWSEITVAINTYANTASLAVRPYDDTLHALGSTTSLLSDQALGLDAGALKDLRWDLRGGSLDNGAVSYNQYFDDFNFTTTPVPEPGSVLLLAAASLPWLWQRRRRITAAG